MRLSYFNNQSSVKVTYSKVSHVRDENSGLDDSSQRRAGLLENYIQVLAALSRLLGDSTLNQGAIGSQGDLAGAVDGSGSLDGLRLDKIYHEMTSLLKSLKPRGTHVGAEG